MSINDVAFPVSGIQVQTKTHTIGKGANMGVKVRKHYLTGYMSDGTAVSLPVTASMAERFRRGGITAVTGKGKIRKGGIKQKKKSPKKVLI